MAVVERSTVRARPDRVRARRLRVLVPLAVVLLVSPAAAAVIRLTGGGLIEAQAWREVGDELEVVLEGGILRVPKADVVRIDGPPPRPVAPPTPPPAARPIPPPAAKAAPAAPSPTSPPAMLPLPPIAAAPRPASVAPPAPPPAVPPVPVAVLKVTPTAPSPISRPAAPPVPVAVAKAAPSPTPPSGPALPAVPPPPPMAAVSPIPVAVVKAVPSAPPSPRPIPATAPPAAPSAAAPLTPRLSTVGADGRTVDQWRRDLASPAVEVRRRAASALAELAESDADTVISLLTPALKDGDAQVRIVAALVLWPHGREPQAVTAVLVSTLGATDVARRRTGSQVLVMMGPAAKDAAPALLLAFASDPDATVRQNAATALRQIGPAAAEVVPGLTSALRHKDPEVRRAAAMLLDDLGSPESAIQKGAPAPRP